MAASFILSTVLGSDDGHQIWPESPRGLGVSRIRDRVPPGFGADQRYQIIRKTLMKSLFKPIFAGHLLGIILLGALASAPAQSAWNYVITDAGGGNSLLTWSVTGDLATPAGSVLVANESSLMASINSPGIFVAGLCGPTARGSIDPNRWMEVIFLVGGSASLPPDCLLFRR